MAKVLAHPREEWRKALSSASEDFHWGVDEPQIERVLNRCLNAHWREARPSDMREAAMPGVWI